MTTEQTPTPANPDLTPRSLLKRLQTDFPVFRDCQPLAIGIDKQLQARLQPVLGRIGTPVRPKTAPRRAAKRSTRSAAKREPRVTPAKATTRSARRRRA